MSQAFMTPSQQREYLAELRRQNAEMYGLTGSRIKSDRDPWTSSDAPSNTNRAVQHEPFSDIGARTSAPPRPPKSSQLRNVNMHSTGKTENPTPLPLPTSEATRNKGAQTQNTYKVLPKPLPKPATKNLPDPPAKYDHRSSDMPDVSMLELDTKKKRHPPGVAPKPQGFNHKLTTSQKKVSLSLMNYDIPQFQEQYNPAHTEDLDYGSDGPSNSDVQSKRMTIPTFSFPDEERPYDQSNRNTAVAMQSELETSIPTFSFSVEDEQNQPDNDVDRNYMKPQVEQDPRTRQSRKRKPIPERERDLVERGLRCANCYEAFGRGRVITANGRRYHPSHFTCFECGIPLEHVDFYTHNATDSEEDDEGTEEVYCHFDYHELFSPRCHVCTTPVIRDGIKALGHVYHAEHFFCALCSKTFERDDQDGTEFVERDDLPWHPQCYEEKFSKTYMCRKCKKRIPAGTQVITMGTGSHFHHDCFQCALCKRSLEDGFYWSKAREGICKPCKELEIKQDL
ncbi:LIM domain-containing protein C4F6.12 [Taphrina deformans PYCC 5710]|uniref:LIM domain-containing protein C4F6.12 n=1 Tax=Taphrina deformans (strain PYCC 5710 / ATCC 11124 / CBS 356.35 / IMI 108563 / JCM 9778 / NBRC 8474) TaxID=1097556 RepID=R4XCM2_TAPDE|nr:LIM domain-containing protein C4F6.12 [Taphrina deformans PYCC 5710]|eukprot:CCG82121.1 LIM domain-containing protein C4F6.12 [Taphrina deformans PYCC 5710]